MEQPKTYLEALEIDKPDKWLEEATEEVKGFLAQKEEVFHSVCIHFLEESNPEMLAFLIAIPPLNPGTVNLCKLFYHMGFLKGLSVGESRVVRNQQLKKLLEE